jgi:hypothetical protein
MRADATRRVYDGALTVLLGAAMLYGLATVVLAPAVERLRPVVGSAELLAVVCLGLGGVVLRALSRGGPLWTTPPELQWRPLVPLLTHRRWLLVTGIAAASVVVGAMWVGSAGVVTPSVVLEGVVVLGSCLAVGCTAMLGQQLDRASTLGWLGFLLECLAIAVALHGGSHGLVPTAVLVAAGAYAVVVQASSLRDGAHAPRWRPWPPRWELRRAGDVVGAARDATVMLDGAALELVRDVQLAARRRRLTVPAAVRPFVRTLSSSRVAVMLPAVALPAALAGAGDQGIAVAGLLVVVAVFGARAGRLLDVYVDTPSLVRTYAVARPRLLVVLVSTTLAMMCTYAVAGALLAGLNPLWAVTAATVAVIAWLRRLSGRRLGARVGALLSTPMGSIPIDLALRVVAGYDVLAVALLVLPGVAAHLAFGSCLAVAAGYFLALTARGR